MKNPQKAEESRPNIEEALMIMISAIFIFSLCFVLMTSSSFILGGSIEKLKTHFRLSGGLLGMIAALAANTPEISSAVTALFIGQHDVGVGIIIGSSIFNLAALLGLSALIAGRLIVRREGVIFNGVASFRQATSSMTPGSEALP